MNLKTLLKKYRALNTTEKYVADLLIKKHQIINEQPSNSIMELKKR